MDLSLCKDIISEASSKGIFAVKFNLRGEPLLNKDLSKMVKFAKDKGIIDVFFNTNALLLNEGLSYQLIEAGLDRIIISFEGFDKTTYESYRRGSNFGRLGGNCQSLYFI